jgi:hypothetical protein
MSSIVQETLDAHNALRAAHGAPPLEWSDECAEHAQMQADAMAAAGSIFHDNTEGPSGRHGQNVAMAMPEIDATMAIKMWYNEVNDPGHDFSGEFSGGTGHFTQVVWAGTTHVGLAINGCYVSANYLPAGNMMGDFQANVFESDNTDADELIGAGAPKTRGIKMPAAPKIPGMEKITALFACCAGSKAVGDMNEETFEDFVPDEFAGEEEEDEE